MLHCKYPGHAALVTTSKFVQAAAAVAVSKEAERRKAGRYKGL